ncbi:site-specific integrase [Aeromonas hydrophila]|uniref:site-specific integrase n=1 Tax=Aeromonas hydrophila TaxID=644 RepID=UPI002B488C21|nr:site-specific integrase [Aeromonas hydrophila]
MSSIISITQEKSPAHFGSAERISKDGYSFNFNADIWTLNKDVRIVFMPEVLSMNSMLLDGFKRTLAIYAEEQSAHHTSNMYLRFQGLLRDTKFTHLDDKTLLNWRAMLGKEHEWYLGALRGFLISWHEYRHYGVSKDIVQLLETLTISGNKKGISVANRCPYSGAFTDNEMLALNNELIRLFKEDSISFSCYAYVNLLQATARRPIQLRQLKSIDLQKIQNTKSNSFDFYLNIPRAKQRGVGFREEFKKLAITEDLYLILLNFIEQETKKLKYRFNTELTPEQNSQIPVFIDWPIVDKLSIQKNQLDDAMLASDILHISATDIREIILKDFKVKQKAISERTGDYIHITARRFRHTRGTNLGRKGLGPLIIAEALDHNDTQNVMVYTENTADTATYIDKAIGKQLAPFANAFLGRIIEQLDEGERGSDLTAHVPNKENEVVGACGTNDYCVKGYESCYTCMKFRPLLDAPHEKLLASLYAEKEIRLKETKSEEYASTKDRLILAVEWVVQKCAEMKEVRS